MIYFNHSLECEPSDIVRGGDFYYRSTECEPSDIVTGDDFFTILRNVNPHKHNCGTYVEEYLHDMPLCKQLPTQNKTKK